MASQHTVRHLHHRASAHPVDNLVVEPVGADVASPGPKRRRPIARASLVALAVSALAACSSLQPHAAQPQVWATLVDASAGSADATPGEPVLGGLVTQKIATGLYWQVVPDLFAVHACDAGTGGCRHGIAKPVARVTLLQAGATSAKVTLQAEYNVGASQTLTNGLPVSPMTTTLSVPAGVPVMSTHVERVERTAELPYGQLRKVTLPDGVTLGLCISDSREPVMPPSGACPAGTDVQHLGGALHAATTF
ncbi:hypothetical protein G3N59_25470 [Paraburkholderia sp. Ac-20340]|uniref:hypothetical protein n=1 Tax=Paraburkholderia sp. Ac-20340 TaxID=2703888 RepID=UPI00197F4317|nr:hypothetical protein [Paraburkholderia sp. Ac-20340]MBN3856735.1 hypothetical protein [Paraburkholderia sp. Ac-20340]